VFPAYSKFKKLKSEVISFSNQGLGCAKAHEHETSGCNKNNFIFIGLSLYPLFFQSSLKFNQALY
jgi:hypothetical protein